jgi:ABC-2 type transport system ATP-binding protein
MSVMLSSHLVSDLERACDYLVVLTAAQIRLAGEVSELLAAYRQQAGAQASLEDLVLSCLSQAAGRRHPVEETR